MTIFAAHKRDFPGLKRWREETRKEHCYAIPVTQEFKTRIVGALVGHVEA